MSYYPVGCKEVAEAILQAFPDREFKIVTNEDEKHEEGEIWCLEVGIDYGSDPSNGSLIWAFLLGWGASRSHYCG